MSNLDRCGVCKGRKKVVGMGGMQKDCSNCRGIGWIEKKIIPILQKKRRKPVKPALTEKPVMNVQEPAQTGE